MPVNTTLVNNAYNAALANPARARAPGWAKLAGQAGFTAAEDLPELRRRLLAVRHVFPVATVQGWAA